MWPLEYSRNNRPLLFSAIETHMRPHSLGWAERERLLVADLTTKRMDQGWGGFWAPLTVWYGRQESFVTRYQLRREHDNRRRLNSFDYCDDDEDDDENDSLCELSVSTSVALGMNTSVADDADSDSDVSTPDQDQHDDSVVTAPQREHCYRLPFDSECNCLDSDVSSIDQLDDHPYLERPRSAENERKDVERRLECMHSSIDTIFPSEVQNTIMRYLDLKSLKNLKLMNGIYRVHVTCEVKRRRLFAWTQSDLRRGFEARYQEYLSAQREQDKKRKLQIKSMYDVNIQKSIIRHAEN